jgi:hypothetical protein
MEARTVPAPAGISPVKLIAGAFFTLVGIVLTLGNLDIIDAEDYLAWWPMVLVAIGAVKLAARRTVLGSILIVAGAWATAYNLGYLDVTLFDLWPLLLIGVGIVLVGRAVGVTPPRLDLHAGDAVWSVLGVRKIVETSRDYRGHRYISFMGGFEIDLTGADIVQSPAVLEAYCMWSGIEIYVPYDWEVVGEVLPVMGGFEVKLRSGSVQQKKLIVRGTAVMAGVEVKSAPRRTA